MNALLLALALLPAAPVAGDIVPRRWLAIEAVDLPGRRPFRPDRIYGECVAAGVAPDTLRAWIGEGGVERRFAPMEADESGALPGPFAWAWTTLECDTERVMLARLSGAARGFVNQAPVMGDAYGYGWPGVPVLLKKGRNDVWIAGPRGRASLRFVEPAGEILFGEWDLTKPDLVAGEPRRAQPPRAGVLLVNATTRAIAPRLMECVGEPPRIAPISRAIQLPPIAPLSLAKVALPLWGFERAPREPGTTRFHFAIDARTSRTLHSFELAVRASDAPRLATFESGIDGTVQVLGMSAPMDAANLDPRVVLSLHGAGVDAWGQINAYSRKPGWLHIAATNRRPYGFDWQDWGRIDAYEALAAGLRAHRGEPAAWMAAPRAQCCDARVYLNGHSMGGHGTWHLAANDPDRFLAIAPSAGWVDFDSYGSRPQGELRELWHAADGASRTLELVSNLAQVPTFVVHGTADDNVPVGEARTMIDALTRAGAAPRAHFEEGAGHWWDGERAAGADCLEWPGVFELYAEHDRADPPRRLSWRGVDPGVDATHHWIEVRQVERHGEPFAIEAELDARGALDIRATNARRLRIGARIQGWNGELNVDGQRVEDASSRHVVRLDGAWRAVAEGEDEALGEKTPELSGPFKRAFDRRFVFVVGTAGTREETELLLSRARGDLQQWWYRGNGSCEIISDAQLFADATRHAGRNLILYGNADTNSAWTRLLADSPLVVRRGVARLGEREWRGEDLGAVFVRRAAFGPPGAELPCLVGVQADSGRAGLLSGFNLSPFTSGVGYPDYALWNGTVHAKGDGGVLAAGWFDSAWRLDGRGFVRADPGERTGAMPRAGGVDGQEEGR